MKIISIKNIIISLSIFFAQILIAQEVDSIQKNKLTRFSNQISLEVLGSGGYGSVNFETGISGKFCHLNLSIGIGLTPFDNYKSYSWFSFIMHGDPYYGSEFSFPIGIHYLLGKKTNFWELGGAFTPNTMGKINYSIYSGYRIAISKNKITTRILLNIMFAKTTKVSDYKMGLPFPSISIGYHL
jgi:hypothetical protein